ncbi:MAG: hypothetical protein N3E47_07410 [Candidatus Bathyarchaeota archaeon]|nr:hypothetical protein [Candidatus Bathyarchaeota archaeon]
MIVGAWFHPSGIERIEDSGFANAVKVGIKAARTYDCEHSERIANILAKLNMSLYAGIDINPVGLLKNWRDEIRQDQILKTLNLNIPLIAICLGNELREYMKGNIPNWKFTGRLAFSLSNLITETRKIIREYGFNVPVTYAMEGFGLGADGKLQEYVVPIVEAVDIYSANCYPMEAKDWFTLDAFRHNRDFLTNEKETNLRLVKFELMLRYLLNELEKYDKCLILSEVGIHAGVDFKFIDKGEEVNVIEAADGKIMPIQDKDNFMKVYLHLANLISRVNKDYSGRIKCVLIYEWRDNPFHTKIKSENSPVHACFGLCYVDGKPKFDISKLTLALGATE